MLEQQVTVRYSDGRPINEILKQIFEERPDLPGEVELFEVEGGKTALFSAGDGHDFKITIGFENVTPLQLKILDIIIEIARKAGATVMQSEALLSAAKKARSQSSVDEQE